MITDAQTNYVLFSNHLPQRHPSIFHGLTKLLKVHGVDYGLLSFTNDIWCRDYMPVQVSRKGYIQFLYNPSYLHIKKYKCTMTNAALACCAAGIRPRLSDLVIDGGNVVRSRTKVILTDRIYRENPQYAPRELVLAIKKALKVRTVIVIPTEPGDPFGHADGCIRFIGENMVMINESIKETRSFTMKLCEILKEHELNVLEVPYFRDYDPRHEDSAVGNYINYLEVGSLVIVPSYKGHEQVNRLAKQRIRRAFGSSKKVVSLEATALAKEGGVYNCVSSNIRRFEDG